MRIAFVGLPLAALLLADDGHEIVWAGISRPGFFGTRRLKKRIGADKVTVVPDLEKAASRVRELAPDHIVSWFWTKKVPPAFLAIAPGFGVHPSLLPRHRGPDPYFWAIDAGDEETGVTAHVLEEEYDTGAILGQKTLRIEPSWTAWTLARKLDRPSLALLRETAARFASEAPPAGVPQDDTRATEAPSPTDDDLELRWTDTSAQIVRRVRAASPWPGAFTALGEATIVLTRVAATEQYPRALEPGEAAVRADGTAIVRTRDGAVELLAGRDEDDEETELDRETLAYLVGNGEPIA